MKDILRKVLKTTIPRISYRFLSSGDRDELESFLCLKLVENVLPKIDTSKSEPEILGYIQKSLAGWALNYFRDHNRMIRIPRALHDRYKYIQITKAKNPHLAKPENIDRLLSELSMCLAEYYEAIDACETRIHRFEPYMASLMTDEATGIDITQMLDIEDLQALDRYLDGQGSLDALSNDAKETISLFGAEALVNNLA